MKEGRLPLHLEKSLWIFNPHGILNCLPETVGRDILKKKPGYRLAEPNEIPYIPEEKQYPVDESLTEAGEKRRARAQKASKAKAEGVEAPKPVMASEVLTEENVADVKKNYGALKTKLDAGETLTKVEYRALEWLDLRKYAAGRGIQITNIKKADMLVELDRSHL
jgi:hypothetical protein